MNCFTTFMLQSTCTEICQAELTNISATTNKIAKIVAHETACLLDFQNWSLRYFS